MNASFSLRSLVYFIQLILSDCFNTLFGIPLYSEAQLINIFFTFYKNTQPHLPTSEVNWKEYLITASFNC